ncbi:MAG: DUF4188 domain-containing protein [Candidatus Caenarcaniphilales bacterium]|nr:DUF4188 domain-containing protein [Candidatus Caenarcaniphilales bacterium]
MKDKYIPYRFSADLNKVEGENFVIIKLGFFWHTLKGFIEFFRYSRLINKSAEKNFDKGLLKMENFIYSHKHAGLIQYWRSFEDLEHWSRNCKDHLSWWKEIETNDQWRNLSFYHEVFIVNKSNVETIYNLNHSIKENEYPGLSGFLPHLTNAKYRARERFLEEPKTLE